MNREELIAEISKLAKVSKKDASAVLTATLDTIQNSVKKGNKVTLVGLVLSNLVKELKEQAETLKQVKKLKSLQKQFLHSQQVKNSKN